MAPPRLLIPVVGMSGHLHPLIPTAQALQRAGCEVLFATDLGGHASLAEAGLAAAECGPVHDTLSQDRARLDAQIATLPPAPRRAVSFSTIFGARRAPTVVDPLLALAKDWKPDALLAGLESVAAPLVAELLRLPLIVHGFGIGLARDVVEATSEAVAPLWEQRGLAAPADAGIYAGLYVDPCPESLRPPDVARAKACQPVRPAAFDGFGVCPPLPSRRPLVYVTLGTNPLFAAPRRLASTLEALANSGVGALITGIDRDQLGPLPEHVAAHRFVPQSALLPSCDAVICHAGASSLFGTLAHGLPSLLLPIGADQFANALAAERLGASVVLEADASATAVEAALRRVLEDASLRARARAVAEEIRAMPSPDQTARGILAWLARR
jgi:UDP:flavonoid glycosyltransferase YjiC (YdhE family)